MPDFNPIPAEFGEDPTKLPVAPADKKTPEPNSTAFLEEMEKKSRRVEEKDQKEKTKQEKEATHESIILNPIIEEREVTTNQYLESVFDVQTVSSKDETSSPDKKGQLLQPDSIEKKQTSIQEVQAPTQDDAFGKNLASPIGTVEKTTQPVSKSTLPKGDPLANTPSEEPVIDSKKPIQTETSSGSQNQNFGGALKNPQAQPSSPLEGNKESFKKPLQESTQKTEEPKIFKETQKKPFTPEVTNQTVTPKEIPSLEEPLLLSENQVGNQSEPTSTPKMNIDPSFIEMPQEEQLEKTPQKPIETSPQQLEEATSPSSATLFSGPLPIESKKKEGPPLPEEESSEESLPIQAPSASSSLDQEEEKERDSDFESTLLTETVSQGPVAPPNVSIEGPAAPEKVLSGFDRLPPHILDWFDRMVGIITVLQTQGKTETTVELNSPKAPELAGTQIKITEYSTAPQAYNIEFTGSPEAVNMLQKQVDPLKNAFKTKNFNFTVNEITISLQNQQSTQEGNDL